LQVINFIFLSGVFSAQRFLPKAESLPLLAVKLAQQEVLIRKFIKKKLANAAAKFKKMKKSTTNSCFDLGYTELSFILSCM